MGKSKSWATSASWSFFYMELEEIVDCEGQALVKEDGEDTLVSKIASLNISSKAGVGQQGHDGELGQLVHGFMMFLL